MTTTFHSNEIRQETERDFENIMSINNFDNAADELDYNFDYDPNEIYYELATRKF